MSSPKRVSTVIAFALVSALLVYFVYERWARHRFIIDDAFISYRYAENLVRGHGLVFNPGERVEGYTNFMWVQIAALAIALGAEPHAIAVALGVGSFLLSAVLCAAVACFVRKASLASLLPPLLVLAAFALARGFADMAGTGLETSFVGLLVLAMGLFNHLWPPERALGRALAALTPLLALLTRLDAAPAVAASGLIYLFQEWSRRGRLAAGIASALWRFGPAAVGLGAFLLFKWLYYGGIIPLTYWAKGADFVPLQVGVRYVVGFLRHSPWVLLLAPIGLWAALCAPERRVRWFARYAVVALTLHAGYVVKVGGDFMHYRFVWEAMPLFIALCAVGLAWLPSRLFALGCVALALPLATVEPYLEHQHEMHELAKMNDYTRSGIRVGRALAQLPPDTLIATTLAGTIGYYSKLPLVDEWGLNDPYVARLDIETFAGRGHVKRAPVDYLKQRGVNFVIGHPHLLACNAAQLERRPTVLLPTQDEECVAIWYLTQTREITEYLCAARKRLRLHLIACPAPNAPVR